MSEGEFAEVRIPKSLYLRIARLIENSGFNSVDEYVTYVLREVVATQEAYEEGFSEEDKREIIEKLRKLGYI